MSRQTNRENIAEQEREMIRLERELATLKGLADKMASACETTYSAIEWPADGTSDVEIAAAEYRKAYPKP